MQYSGRIVVEDASGARFHIYQYKVRRFFMPVTQFVLSDTGQVVRRLDVDNYVVVATGETLVRA